MLALLSEARNSVSVETSHQLFRLIVDGLVVVVVVVALVVVGHDVTWIKKQVFKNGN